jgi:hypothetical protein
MPDPAAAFHTAQDEALRGSQELAALWPGGVVRLYSVVPQNAPLPFLRVGDDQIIDDGDQCATSSEIFSTVHLWTKPDPPSAQLGRRIAGVLRTVLVALDLTDFDTEVQVFVDARHMTDADGSSHAVLTFHYFTTALSPAL